MDIDIYRYIDEEEDQENYGKRIYLNASNLVDDIISKLEKEYKDYDIETNIKESKYE